MSSRGASGSREVGTVLITNTMATAATGAMARKALPHQKCSRSQPPTMGPKATPIPVVAPQMPMALARSARSVNTLDRIDSVFGNTMACSTPPRRCWPTRRRQPAALTGAATPSASERSRSSSSCTRPYRVLSRPPAPPESTWWSGWRLLRAGQRELDDAPSGRPQGEALRSLGGMRLARYPQLAPTSPGRPSPDRTRRTARRKNPCSQDCSGRIGRPTVRLSILGFPVPAPRPRAPPCYRDRRFPSVHRPVGRATVCRGGRRTAVA